MEVKEFKAYENILGQQFYDEEENELRARDQYWEWEVSYEMQEANHELQEEAHEINEWEQAYDKVIEDANAESLEAKSANADETLAHKIECQFEHFSILLISVKILVHIAHTKQNQEKKKFL